MSEDELVHLRRQVAACRDTNRYVGPCTQCEPSAPWGEMFACGEEADGSEDDEGTLYIQRLACARDCARTFRHYVCGGCCVELRVQSAPSASNSE